MDRVRAAYLNRGMPLSADKVRIEQAPDPFADKVEVQKALGAPEVFSSTHSRASSTQGKAFTTAGQVEYLEALACPSRHSCSGICQRFSQ